MDPLSRRIEQLAAAAVEEEKADPGLPMAVSMLRAEVAAVRDELGQVRDEVEDVRTALPGILTELRAGLGRVPSAAALDTAAAGRTPRQRTTTYGEVCEERWAAARRDLPARVPLPLV